MTFQWTDYDGGTLPETWLDEDARRFTGCDSWQAFYDYWRTSGELSLGSDFWCKYISLDDRPVGILALNIYEGICTVMEIVLDPACRGRGLGTVALRELLVEPILGRPFSAVRAVIFPENTASRKAFEKAGFRPAPPRLVGSINYLYTASGGIL